jgi:hypothetical protein
VLRERPVAHRRQLSARESLRSTTSAGWTGVSTWFDGGPQAYSKTLTVGRQGIRPIRLQMLAENGQGLQHELLKRGGPSLAQRPAGFWRLLLDGW